jgi:hypothetical protein
LRHALWCRIRTGVNRACTTPADEPAKAEPHNKVSGYAHAQGGLGTSLCAVAQRQKTAGYASTKAACNFLDCGQTNSQGSDKEVPGSGAETACAGLLRIKAAVAADSLLERSEINGNESREVLPKLRFLCWRPPHRVLISRGRSLFERGAIPRGSARQLASSAGEINLVLGRT